MCTGNELITGAGSPVVDLIAEVDESFILGIPGEKGGMELVDPGQMEKLIASLPSDPTPMAGGSAANTIFAMARLGMKTSFLGKLGNDDSAAFYEDTFARIGGDLSRFKKTDRAPTARCLSLVTPDSERTMRTDLGAAALMEVDDVQVSDFSDCKHLHVEGYLLFNTELITRILAVAKQCGCSISLDMGSFEVVNIAIEFLPDLLDRYVDIVFANEDEGRAFCGDDDPVVAADTLMKYCDIVAVKLGPEGALIHTRDEQHRISAELVEYPIDTTGAGDYWAAGFLYGYLQGRPLHFCGQIGSLLAAEVVQQIGADLPEEVWGTISNKFKTGMK